MLATGRERHNPFRYFNPTSCQTTLNKFGVLTSLSSSPSCSQQFFRFVVPSATEKSRSLEVPSSVNHG